MTKDVRTEEMYTEEDMMNFVSYFSGRGFTVEVHSEHR